MIIKNKHREKLTEMGFIFTTALNITLFYEGVLSFNIDGVGIACVLYGIYAIFVCAWFDELHIKEDKIVSKCFYYEKDIHFKDIQFIMYHKSRVVLHDQQGDGIHAFINDGSERYQIILEKLREANIPAKSYSLNLSKEQ